MQTATLTIEWDSYSSPTQNAMFGLDAITQVDGLPTMDWVAKADVAWDWLEAHGFKPVGWGNGKRLPFAGYVRPVTIRFIKTANGQEVTQ